ncbi:hypothetical protein, partial [Microcystis aeruginosa]|uniref:hypothetical protein n=1 Tax=Microcystis aeruginosa TaxID=1126 RepID=UPI001C12B99F
FSLNLSNSSERDKLARERSNPVRSEMGSWAICSTRPDNSASRLPKRPSRRLVIREYRALLI